MPATPRTTGSASRVAPASPSEETREELCDVRSDTAELLASIGSLEFSRAEMEDLLSRERAEQSTILYEVKDVCEKRINTLQQLCEEFRSQASETKSTSEKEIRIMQKKMNAAHMMHTEQLAKAKAAANDRLTLEVNSTKKRLQDTISSLEQRYSAEVQSLKERNAKLTSENTKLRTQTDSQHAELNRQLLAARQENVKLCSEIVSSEQKFNSRMEMVSSQLSETTSELSSVQDLLTRTQLRLAESEAGNDLLRREVKIFRALIDKEAARITPSKKRKIVTTSSTPADQGMDNDPSTSMTTRTTTTKTSSSKHTSSSSSSAATALSSSKTASSKSAKASASASPKRRGTMDGKKAAAAN